MPRQHFPGGFLIAVEGIDGSGKTTQARFLQRHLEDLGYEVVLTKEPTDGPWGRRIRASKTEGRLPPDQELEAFLEDRRQHVEELLRPSLEAGKVVILDRYYFSTVAYQGARGYDPRELLAANEAFAPEPDLLVVLAVAPETGLARVHARGDTADAFEEKDRLRRSAEIFAGLDKPYLLRVDAERPVDDVSRDVEAALHRRMEEAIARRTGPRKTR